MLLYMIGSMLFEMLSFAVIVFSISTSMISSTIHVAVSTNSLFVCLALLARSISALGKASP